ncbi:MAG TPA: MarR family transcriptional regulator [Gemmatimonas sp.]|nr:MarR family transcriptional regulator [Gemmatimonas sp.]
MTDRGNSVASGNASSGSRPDASTPALAVRALRATAAHLERTLARALEPHGLTTAQFAALQVLNDAKEQSLGCTEVGKRLAGPAPDVTRLLDRLEAGGLVARDRNQEDRRLVHTRITPDGERLLHQAAPSYQEAESRALGELDPEEQEHLVQLLSGIQRNCPGQ